MPSYDVPVMMHQLFYVPLKEADWTAEGTHQGEEWVSPDREFEIRFRHSNSILTVEYRRYQQRRPDEATTEFYARRGRARWNSFSREYGHTAESMRAWSVQVLVAIDEWIDQMGPLGTEVAEVEPSAVPA